jgi:hypothetical protein
MVWPASLKTHLADCKWRLQIPGRRNGPILCPTRICNHSITRSVRPDPHFSWPHAHKETPVMRKDALCLSLATAGLLILIHPSRSDAG